MKTKFLQFFKMQGAGNDFVVMESQGKVNLKALAAKVCDRSTGIGADGLLVLEPSKKSDYRMRIINADGSEAEMCGNGARCMAVYVQHACYPKKETFTLETLAGEIACEVSGEMANVRLSDPYDYRQNIPVKVNGRVMQVNFINTGVPHAIIFVSDLDQIPVSKIGQLIRYHKAFQPKGTNVNFVERVNAKLVRNRTYERGVEDETKACGTGSVASAIVTYLSVHPDMKNVKAAKIKVQTSSGDILEVKFDITDGQLHNVWLKGPAKFVAKGEFYV